MKTSSKYFCCSICCSVSAIISVVFAVTFFLIVGLLISNGAKKESALSVDTYSLWGQIPGEYDIALVRRNYVYNCTNYEDVIYLGAQPEFEEFGPYSYREYDNFTDPDYDQMLEVPGSTEGEMFKAVKSQIRTAILYYTEEEGQMDSDIDTPIYQINQAAQGVWWTGQNTDYWRVAITVLYTLVTDGLGRQVAEEGAWTAMQLLDFQSANRVKTALLGRDATITDEQTDAIFNDEYYGLSSMDNYGKWDQLLDKMEPVNKRLFKNELKFYFGLTQAEVDLIETNWNALYQKRYDFVMLTVPTNYQNDQGVAYWQWADGYMTMTSYDAPTVVGVTDTVVGYPEISYFRDAYLLPNINTDNAIMFQDVALFVDKSDKDSNYEYLFDLTNAEGGDPDANSLFNVNTLKTLISLGEATPDIIEDFFTTLVLGQEWTDLTTTLGLAQPEQTYLIWLWMKYAVDITGNRGQEGGDIQVGILSQMAAPAIETSVGKMQLELPVIIHAYQFYANYDSVKSCADIYTSYGFTDPTALTKICNDAELNFSDALLTSFILMNVFFNKDTYLPQYYQAFVDKSTAEMVDSVFSEDDSAFVQEIMSEVMGPVYEHYKDSVCTLSVNSNACSLRELVFNQWAFGEVLKNPLPNFPEYDPALYQSYTRVFPDMTQLRYTPEYSYFLMRAQMEQPALSLENVWLYMNVTRLFNLKPIQDIILDTDPTNPFNNDQTRRFIQFIMLEETLMGMFYYQTPRENLEGYNDPLIESIATLPVYMGGDATNPSFMSVNESPLTPHDDNLVAQFQGDDDYIKTRQQALWLGSPYVTVRKHDYVSISQIETVYVEPWAERVWLQGTDGIQVHPLLTDENIEDIMIWVPDLSRSGGFQLKNITQDDDFYKGIKTYYVVLDNELMWSDEYNADNVKYYTKINGTANLSSSLGAPIFASKGHYYQIPESLGITPIVRNHAGEVIQAEEQPDETFLAVESYSGLPLIALQRLQMNFYIEQDLLFGFLQSPTFIPLAFIKKESALTQEQADDILGDIYLAESLILPVSIVLAALGIIFVILACCFLSKYKQHYKREKLGIADKDSYAMLDTSSGYPGKINVTSELTNSVR